MNYTEVLDAYRHDDCVRAAELLAEPGPQDPRAASLREELSRKLAHLTTAETYRDKYEWVATQIPIHRLTWEVFRTRWIVTYVRALAKQGYSTLLDVGCQKGEMTVWFGQVEGLERVVGVDVAPTCVEDARTNPQNTEIVSYVEGDAEDLPFDDDEFSIVVASGLMEHVRRPDVALAEAKRVCVNGGVILGNTPMGGYEYFPEKDAQAAGDVELVRRHEWRAHVRLWNPHIELMYEPEVVIAFNDMTGDPNLPFACKGIKTGEWCFMLRVVKQ